jgi:hypothetical protein
MKKIAMLAGLLALAAGIRANALPVTLIPIYNNVSSPGDMTLDGNLAQTFTANKAVKIYALGEYNPSGTGIFSDNPPGNPYGYPVPANVQVGLYDLTTSTVLAEVTFLPNTPYYVQGYDAWQLITPLTLTAGHNYVVDAIVTDAQQNGEGAQALGAPGPVLNNFFGAITFTGADYDNLDTSFNWPHDNQHCINNGCIPLGLSPNPNQWEAGTIAAGTPEPGSLMLLGTGIAGLAGLLRRKLRA